MMVSLNFPSRGLRKTRYSSPRRQQLLHLLRDDRNSAPFPYVCSIIVYVRCARRFCVVHKKTASLMLTCCWRYTVKNPAIVAPRLFREWFDESFTVQLFAKQWHILQSVYIFLKIRFEIFSAGCGYCPYFEQRKFDKFDISRNRKNAHESFKKRQL